MSKPTQIQKPTMQVRPLQFLQGCITLEHLDQCRWPAIQGSLGLGVQFHVLVRDSNQHLDFHFLCNGIIDEVKSCGWTNYQSSNHLSEIDFALDKSIYVESRYIQLATKRRLTEDLSQYHHGSVHKGNSLTTQQLFFFVSAQLTLALIDPNQFCPKFGPKTLTQQFKMIQT